MKNKLFFIFLLGSYLASAQISLNDYKYIIVPKKLDDFKRENQHQTSTLIKYLFAKKGFLAVYDDNLPEDLNKNRCLGLLVGFDDGSSMFTTKVTLRLKDCNSRKVFTTKEGRSKLKEYKQAYGEAIRDAFTSFDAVNYEYSVIDKEEAPIIVSFKNDVKRLEKEKVGEPKNIKTEAVIKQETTTERQTYKSLEPKESDIKRAVPMADKVVPASIVKTKSATLYAQELSNGYQLVDSTPKIQMRLFTTSARDFYIAKRGNKNGILFKNDGQWVFEYYEDDILWSKELDIKF